MVNAPRSHEIAGESAQLSALKDNLKVMEAVKTMLQSDCTDKKMLAAVRDEKLVQKIESTRAARDNAFLEMRATFRQKPYLPATNRIQIVNTTAFQDVSLLDAYDKFDTIQVDAPKDIVAEKLASDRIGESLQTYNDDVIARRIQDIPSEKIDEEQRTNGLRWQRDIVAKIRAAKEANAAYESALRDGIQALLPEQPYQRTKAIIMPSDPLLNVRRKILEPLRDLRSKLLQATGYTEETMKNSLFYKLSENNLQLLVQSGTPAAEGNILSVLDDLIELAKNADAKNEPNPFDFDPAHDEELVAPKAAETPQETAQKVKQTRTGIRGLLSWGNKK